MVREIRKAVVKFDMSLENGPVRLERSNFDTYNEIEVLVSAIRHYCNRHGCYPERVLADKIYRNREDFSCCKQCGIHFSGPVLGSAKKHAIRDKAIEHKSNRCRTWFQSIETLFRDNKTTRPHPF